MFSAALYAHVRTLLPIAHETAGAARIRHSLRPLFSRRAKNFQQSSGASYRENAKLHLPSLRGALATKQSIYPLRRGMDCFAALAMTVLDVRRPSIPETLKMKSIGRGVLDLPLARRTTVVGLAALSPSCERSEAIHSFFRWRSILRGACHRARNRATIGPQ
jgi:hypothetical protein